MFGVSELKQTRVYQEAKAEGKAEGEQSLLLKLLTRRIGTIEPAIESKIRALSLVQIETLGEELLDLNIKSAADLAGWLKCNQ